jgi:hypothetical protein
LSAEKDITLEIHEKTERRRHPRYRTKGNAFVEYVSEHPQIGQIIDISVGGLSFRYFVNATPKRGPYELNIYLKGNHFYLEKTPVVTVSDKELSSILFPKQRRHAVKFGTLTAEQTSGIENFIEKSTIKGSNL